MSEYATISDITSLGRALTSAETTRATSLIPVVCSRLRMEAKKVGRDLDAMITAEPILTNVAKEVTVAIVLRALNTSTTAEPMSQMSQSALGYTVSGTYMNAGGGIYIKKSELSALGLKKQRYGTIDL